MTNRNKAVSIKRLTPITLLAIAVLGRKRDRQLVQKEQDRRACSR